jgi:hypothetical protein
VNYPTFEQLNTAPDYLTFGASAMRNLITYGWLTRVILPPNIPQGLLQPAPLPEKPRKEYQSNYIGVSRRYRGFCGHWAPEPGKYVRGPVRKTEIEAAQDRAAALGLDYVEVRVMEEQHGT